MEDKRQKIEIINKEFAIAKLPVGAMENAEILSFSADFFFFARTDKEVSLVTEITTVPNCALKVEKPYTAFRLQGIYEFELTGVLQPILKILADKKIPVFAISTYDTDYVLVKTEKLMSAKLALIGGGYHIV